MCQERMWEMSVLSSVRIFCYYALETVATVAIICMQNVANVSMFILLYLAPKM